MEMKIFVEKISIGFFDKQFKTQLMFLIVFSLIAYLNLPYYFEKVIANNNNVMINNNNNVIPTL